ncbi:MAG: hypothetical protein HQL32_04445 [Planctomycetes bacterium]|nr:hypothetical protein [Planctomycetota bacterium]
MIFCAALGLGLNSAAGTQPEAIVPIKIAKPKAPVLVTDKSKYPFLAANKDYKRTFSMMAKAKKKYAEGMKGDKIKNNLKPATKLYKRILSKIEALSKTSGLNAIEKKHLEETKIFINKQLYWALKFSRA